MNKRDGTFLSCDWGTSSFRLRLVDTKTLTTIGEKCSDWGIAFVYENWQQQATKGRLLFYQEIIQDHINQLEETLNLSLKNIPLIISGMASSSLGMIELEYKELPFATDGSDLKLVEIPESEKFQHTILLISGVKSDNDVMRGEEVQLVGCLSKRMENQVLVLPGTHSKHVFVSDKKVTGFKTYMTGEFFDLISNKSILHSSVEKGGNFKDQNNLNSFQQGLINSQNLSLLQACFSVRTKILFNEWDRRQNYFYLSGLLIGEELKDLIATPVASITLSTNKLLEPYYAFAMERMLPNLNLEIINADQAIVLGQFKVYKNYIRES